MLPVPPHAPRPDLRLASRGMLPVPPHAPRPDPRPATPPPAPQFGGWGFGMPFFGGGFGVYPVFGFGLSTIFSLMVRS